ncbi:hypothetical protein B188_17890 [Candidatus Brocadiaceae bacterium B188]|nr:hypothetical protein [Candidatus Brocadia sapporoensis]QQR66831.1 MAG: hypothetical protein IPI25_00770 [Candidatus Brocadia sp.]RZV57889.1 MAG: hypothetical protein EX330_08420 [Candidatus Brocadia sp. BROELEC01]TWU53807.1 hypothetical protein B188_17890 [Candidatus Brocadiaceae bacterium B188]
MKKTRESPVTTLRGKAHGIRLLRRHGHKKLKGSEAAWILGLSRIHTSWLKKRLLGAGFMAC